MKKLIGVLLAVGLLVLSVIPSNATVGYFVSPVVRFWDATGTRILTGGYVVTCQTGATCGCTSFTALTTYKDSTGLVANTNPVYLDSTGSASIWYAGTAKISVCDRFGNLQWSRDNVATTTLQTELSVNEWPALSSAIPTYISSSQFSVPGDFTSVLTVGRRLKLTQTSGEIYVTITASTYASGVTTITVISDTVGVDSGIASIAIGIMEPTYPSLPIKPTVTKTAGYTMSAIDCGKTFIANLSSNATFTLPATSAVPSGCTIVTENTGTPPYILTIGGTVDSAVNPQLAQYESLRLLSRGTGTWIGSRSTKADRTVVFGGSFVSATVTSTPTGTAIPVARADGTLDPNWIHAFYTVKTFTTSGTWTVPVGVSDIWLFLRGGGGGGGGGANTVGQTGGGGGAGNLLPWHRYPVTSSETYTITIGTGGTGGAATANGVDGGTTSFIKTNGTGTVSVAGGSGGIGSALGGAAGAPISTIVSSISTTANIGYGLFTSASGYTGTAATGGANPAPAGTGGGISGGGPGASCTPAPCVAGNGFPGLEATGSGGGGGGSGGTGGSGGAGTNGYAVILYF